MQKKNIALIACSNGYGHIRRLLLLAKALHNYGTNPVLYAPESSALSLAINQDSFFKAITQFPDFRAFIFEGYGEQIGKILSVVSELAFERLNARLAQTLLSNARDTNTVNMTHQEIAAEVGSVREVVSRELQHFRRNGWVDLGRGRIVILDRKALSNQALSALAVS